MRNTSKYQSTVTAHTHTLNPLNCELQISSQMQFTWHGNHILRYSCKSWRPIPLGLPSDSCRSTAMSIPKWLKFPQWKHNSRDSCSPNITFRRNTRRQTQQSTKSSAIGSHKSAICASIEASFSWHRFSGGATHMKHQQNRFPLEI